MDGDGPSTSQCVAGFGLGRPQQSQPGTEDDADFQWSDDEDNEYTGTLEEGDFDESDSSEDDLGEADDELSQLLALNQAYSDLVERMIEKAERSLETNREMQRSVKAALGASRCAVEDQSREYNRSSVFNAPYFKDASGMAEPAPNEEAMKIWEICAYDLRLREEKPWTPEEYATLRKAVKESILQNRTMSLRQRKELLTEKLSYAGVEIPMEDLRKWREETERINRRITYIRSRPDSEIFDDDYAAVDWPKIAATDFRGTTRTMMQLRMKWCNEQCPKWSQEPWSLAEDDQLEELAKRPWMGWDVVAEKLGTRRSAYQCFERLSLLQRAERERRPWTLAEDEKLRSLVQALRIAEEIPFHKISCYFPCRTKVQCEERYMKTMEKKMTLGRWSEKEDMYLLHAVNKYGPMDWQRIAEHVPNRAYHQCRDRWINVLDQRRSTAPWTLEEDECLLMGMKVFGRQEYSKISTLLEGRNPHDVRMRVRQLVRYKIEACDATLDAQHVVLHNPSPNYEPLRNRRDVVLNKYSTYMQRQMQQAQEDRSLQLAKRMGYGSFVSTPSGAVADYSVAKQHLMQKFGKWKVLKDGRWIRWIKNSNEYGSKELAKEMNRLPEVKRDELKSFLNELQTQKLVESTYENDKENPQFMAYQRAQTQRTHRRVAQLMGETLTILPMDLARFQKSRHRQPLLKLKNEVRPALSELSVTRRQMSSIMTELAPKRYHAVDRITDKVRSAIGSVQPEHFRSIVIRNLCHYIRSCDEREYELYYRNEETLPDVMLEAVVQRLREQLIVTPRSAAVSEPTEAKRPRLDATSSSNDPASSNDFAERQEFTKRDALKNLVPPCTGTIFATSLFKASARLELTKKAGMLFDPLDADFQATAVDSGTSTDVLDIRLSDEITSSEEYRKLKLRIYRTFFLPMLMYHSTEPAAWRQRRIEQRERVANRRLLEEVIDNNLTEPLRDDEPWPAEVRNFLDRVEQSGVDKRLVFPVYDGSLENTGNNVSSVEPPKPPTLPDSTTITSAPSSQSDSVQDVIQRVNQSLGSSNIVIEPSDLSAQELMFLARPVDERRLDEILPQEELSLRDMIKGMDFRRGNVGRSGRKWDRLLTDLKTLASEKQQQVSAQASRSSTPGALPAPIPVHPATAAQGLQPDAVVAGAALSSLPGKDRQAGTATTDFLDGNLSYAQPQQPAQFLTLGSTAQGTLYVTHSESLPSSSAFSPITPSTVAQRQQQFSAESGQTYIPLQPVAQEMPSSESASGNLRRTAEAQLRGAAAGQNAGTSDN